MVMRSLHVGFNKGKPQEKRKDPTQMGITRRDWSSSPDNLGSPEKWSSAGGLIPAMKTASKNVVHGIVPTICHQPDKVPSWAFQIHTLGILIIVSS